MGKPKSMIFEVYQITAELRKKYVISYAFLRPFTAKIRTLYGSTHLIRIFYIFYM